MNMPVKQFLAKRIRVVAHLEPEPWWRRAWEWLCSPWRGTRLERLRAGGTLRLKVNGLTAVDMPLWAFSVDNRNGCLVLELYRPILLQGRDTFSVGITWAGAGIKATTQMTAYVEGDAIRDVDPTPSTPEAT